MSDLSKSVVLLMAFASLGMGGCTVCNSGLQDQTVSDHTPTAHFRSQCEGCSMFEPCQACIIKGKEFRTGWFAGFRDRRNRRRATDYEIVEQMVEPATEIEPAQTTMNQPEINSGSSSSDNASAFNSPTPKTGLERQLSESWDNSEWEDSINSIRAQIVTQPASSKNSSNDGWTAQRESDESAATLDTEISLDPPLNTTSESKSERGSSVVRNPKSASENVKSRQENSIMEWEHDEMDALIKQDSTADEDVGFRKVTPEPKRQPHNEKSSSKRNANDLLHFRPKRKSSARIETEWEGNEDNIATPQNIVLKATANQATRSRESIELENIRLQQQLRQQKQMQQRQMHQRQLDTQPLPPIHQTPTYPEAPGKFDRNLEYNQFHSLPDFPQEYPDIPKTTSRPSVTIQSIPFSALPSFSTFPSRKPSQPELAPKHDPLTQAVPTKQVSVSRKTESSTKQPVGNRVVKKAVPKMPVLKAFAQDQNNPGMPPVVRFRNVSSSKVTHPAGSQSNDDQEQQSPKLKLRKVEPQPIFDYDALQKSVRGLSKRPADGNSIDR